ncbi:hypothetical protein PR048_029293 [Dryococelus australis]|uniref:Uncharacterized protein n=1 Tax=Dryococelus australis TaxID=614101 RepID=A0ABQ9GDL7_9NEOP|nr:hypothetical protein PR048_029293 [Dryococelus australis]
MRKLVCLFATQSHRNGSADLDEIWYRGKLHSGLALRVRFVPARLLSPLRTGASAVCPLAVAPHPAVMGFPMRFLESLQLAQRRAGRSSVQALAGLPDHTFTYLSRTRAVIAEISYEFAKHRNPLHRPENGDNAADIRQCSPWAVSFVVGPLEQRPLKMGEYGGGGGMKGRGKREIPEKTQLPTASSGTIPTCENSVTRPGIEHGSSWWEASVLIAQPPWPLSITALVHLSAASRRRVPPPCSNLRRAWSSIVRADAANSARGRGGSAISTLAPHQGEPCSIPGRVTGPSPLGIWSAGFLGNPPFPLPLHSGAAPNSLQSPTSALKTSLLRTAQISAIATTELLLLPSTPFASTNLRCSHGTTIDCRGSRSDTGAPCDGRHVPAFPRLVAFRWLRRKKVLELLSCSRQSAGCHKKKAQVCSPVLPRGLYNDGRQVRDGKSTRGLRGEFCFNLPSSSKATENELGWKARIIRTTTSWRNLSTLQATSSLAFVSSAKCHFASMNVRRRTYEVWLYVARLGVGRTYDGRTDLTNRCLTLLTDDKKRLAPSSPSELLCQYYAREVSDLRSTGLLRRDSPIPWQHLAAGSHVMHLSVRIGTLALFDLLDRPPELRASRHLYGSLRLAAGRELGEIFLHDCQDLRSNQWLGVFLPACRLRHGRLSRRTLPSRDFPSRRRVLPCSPSRRSELLLRQPWVFRGFPVLAREDLDSRLDLLILRQDHFVEGRLLHLRRRQVSRMRPELLVQVGELAQQPHADDLLFGLLHQPVHRCPGDDSALRPVEVFPECVAEPQHGVFVVVARRPAAPYQLVLAPQFGDVHLLLVVLVSQATDPISDLPRLWVIQARDLLFTLQALQVLPCSPQLSFALQLFLESNWAPVHNVCSVVVTPLESRRVTSCGYNSSHPVWHALYECVHDIGGDSSPFLLQPFHELSNGFWPRLTSPRLAIQFIPKMFYRVEVGALGGPVQSANSVVGVPLHSK